MDNYKPPDWNQRQLILNELDKNFIVEAAAGTGKTTSLVGRMISLLGKGKCAIHNIVAITFTKKAAVELRTRFQIECEKQVVETNNQLLKDAYDNIEKCFVGTIHSFCARLLRERPVEADISIPFQEIEPDEDLLLRETAWNEYINQLTASETDPFSQSLAGDLHIPDLLQAFLRFTDYPDVGLWPGEKDCEQSIDIEPVIEEIRSYAQHMKRLSSRLPCYWKTDTLIRFYREFPHILPTFNINDPKEVYELLQLFDHNLHLTQKEWTADNLFTKEECKQEKEKWDHFRKNVIAPFLNSWRVCRYGRVIRLFKEARIVYDKMRKSLGKMNFQDLLLKTAWMLGDNPHVRLFFQKKFTHLLVDEFQDTDPVQAEVMMFLTSKNIHEKKWQKCDPIPGSLFVVGDPKQSIYRFRRADIITYNEVKRIIVSHNINGEKGHFIQLSANFRSAKPVREWVNRTFTELFPDSETETSPAYVQLERGKDKTDKDLCGCIYKITIPGEYCKKNDTALQFESERIANYILYLLDHKQESCKDSLSPSDFLIITRRKKYLSIYADALQKRQIPYALTGGTTLNDLRELKLLYISLKAVLNPENSVALAGVLRSELFGISDADLYKYRKAKGSFRYTSNIPEQLSDGTQKLFLNAYNKLKSCHSFFFRLPLIPALENFIHELGLLALSCSSEDRSLKAGGLFKCIELIRNQRADLWSPATLLRYIDSLIKREIIYDNIPAAHEAQNAVRIMNLHQAKGLEARVVFLADSSGKRDYKLHKPDIHITRAGHVTKGFLGVEEKQGFRKNSIAHPDKWGEYQEKESAYLFQEDIRLQYVAATRAMSELIIVQKERNNERNFWKQLNKKFSHIAELPDHEQPAEPSHKIVRINKEDITKAKEKYKSFGSSISCKTYDSVKAKEYALKEFPGHLKFHISESVNKINREEFSGLNKPKKYGTEWGEVIHKLLEIKLKDTKASLDLIAASLLDEYDLNSDLKGEVLLLINSIMQSGIWKRACQSSKMYTEIPYHSILDKKYKQTLPTIIRGVMDLVFLENNSWVIVDFKTDAIRSNKDLIQHQNLYSQQLFLYADAWQQITGEKVNEAGLYFTFINKYIKTF